MKLSTKTTLLLAAILALVAASEAHAADSGVAPNVISLPDGPGSVSGLGEEFAASPNSGTASFGIAIEAPAGSGGLKPELKVLYSGGRGNSVLGFGWQLGLPRIALQTDKGLPRYAGSDRYIYQDATTAEELVPLSDGSFRLKNEGAFIRAAKSGDAWEVRTKSGLIYTLGASASSRVEDGSGTKVFAWNISSVADRNGNQVSFEWSRDGGQAYLERVVYNDHSPSARCEILLSYEARPDALADYRAGFAVVTAKRLARIEVKRGGNKVRSYDFSYDLNSQLTRLAGVSLTGSDGATSMPPLSFGYTRFEPMEQPVVEMQNPPGQGLADPKNRIVDVDADGLPDMLASSPGDYAYYPNVDGVSWGDPVSMAGSPSYDLSQAGVALADLSGDGMSDLVIARSDGNKFLPGTGSDGWAGAIAFDANPVGFDLGDPDTRFADVSGDGMIDVVRTGSSGLSVWVHEGAGLFERLSGLPKIDGSMDVKFSDGRVRLADMNGDGLVDVARLRSESLVYWPSMGYGAFDEPVAVAGAPHADDEARLELVDVNGDGLADVVYLGVSSVSFWLSDGAGSVGDIVTIGGTPEASPVTTSVRFADVNGNGTTDVLWVDVSSGPDGAWQYLDLMGDVRAGLLSKIDNGLGKLVEVEYESSTAQMVRAAETGEPWGRALPFPVWVVKAVSVSDGLGAVSRRAYSYGDGYYDGIEREFRGFSKSIVAEQGDDSIETLVTRTEFDVGVSHEVLKGKPLYVERSSGGGTVYDAADSVWTAMELAAGLDGRQVSFAALESEIKSVIEGGASPKYLRKDYAYDEFGNVTEEIDHGEVASAGDDGSRPTGDDEIVTLRDYAVDEPEWLVGFLSRESVYEGDGTKVAETLYYYDGAVFTGLSLGQIDRGNLTRKEAWLDTEGRYVPVERIRRDSWGNVTALLDAEGGRREIAYDSEGHSLPVAERVFTGDGVIDFKVEYETVFGRVSSFTDPNGSVTRFDYDALGRIVSIAKPGDSRELPTVAYEYDLSAPVSVVTTRLREVTGSPGTLDSYAYFDGLGRTRAEAVEDEDGLVAVTKAALYNSRGKESFQASPFRCEPSSCTLAGRALELREGSFLSYDALARPVETLNPDGTLARVERKPLAEIFYDENDTDPTSPHRGTPTRNSYDGRGRQVAVSFDDAGEIATTSFTYDATGNIVAITDPAGNVRVHEYDSMGRMIALADPNAGRRQYSYDDAGRITQKTRADGVSVKYRYEPTTGRLLAKNLVTSFEDDTWEVKYHYDAPSGRWDGHGAGLVGKLAWVEDAAGSEYYGYDARGRLVAKRRTIGDSAYDISFGYDAADRRTSVGYPDGTTLAIAYDARGFIESVGDYLLDRSYTAAGQVESEALGSGIVRAYSYDSRGRLATLVSVDAEGSFIQSLAYEHDPASNVLRIDDRRDLEPSELVSQSFEYDDLYRLTKANVAGGGISWSYDVVGNITGRLSTLPDGKFHEPEMLYGDGAGPYALTAAGDARYEYDANGNLTGMPGQALQFDAEDRLVRVAKDDGTAVEMVYDHSGQRRIKRVVSSGGDVAETLYVDPLYEVRDGTPFRYVWAGGRRIARVESGTERGDE